MDFLKIATQKGYFSISEDEKRIFYKNTKFWERKEKRTDPEEKVRAEFFVDLLEKYQYESKNIWLEVEMPKRVPNQFADLVIYEPDTNKAYFVIEFKKADISDNEFEQAVKQGIGNGRVLDSQYYGTIAWETQRFFEKWKDESIEDAFYSFPVRYWKPEERTFTKNWTKDIEPITTEALKTILWKAHQTIWKWWKRNPAEAFGEVAKIIFIKVADEKLPRKNWEPYEFQRKRNESTDRLAKRIHGIYDREKAKDPQVFQEDIKLDDKELAAVVEHLQAANLNKTDLDVKGQAFQQFLGNFFKWDFGQYFTPTAVTKFCVDMLGDEIENHHKVLDPACGSWWFLLQMLDFMRIKAEEYFSDEPTKYYEYWHSFAEKKLFWIEISEAIARVAKMNMILHDDGHTNVISYDALDEIEKMKKYNLWFERESFNFIFTNPPFGAVVKKTELDYLCNFELWKDWKKERTSQKTEILFLERCRQFLAPGGNMAIVLPDGILTNSSLQYVRNRILSHFKLRAVISLSQDAFKYYGAGVKSSILILQKREKIPEKEYKIFMATANKIGIDASGRQCENDLPEIVNEFKKFNKNKKTEKSEITFSIDIEESHNNRFDPSFHDPKFKNAKNPKSKYELVPFKLIASEIKTWLPIRKDQRVESWDIPYYWANGIIWRMNDFTHNGKYLIIAQDGYIGNHYVVDWKFWASNHNWVAKIKDWINIDYIKYMLDIINYDYLVTWWVIPKLTKEALEQIKIPLPPIEVQNKITEELSNKIQEANLLKKQAEDVYKKAKDAFSNAVLGE